MISRASAPAVNVTAIASSDRRGRREMPRCCQPTRSAEPPPKSSGSSRIAVLVPCYNEEAAIGKVVADFRAALPEAAHLRLRQQFDRPHRRGGAAQAGAIVRREQHQGKGRVVRRMFTDIEADIYVLVDGDATYDAPSAPPMIEQLVRRAARHGLRGPGRSRGGGLPPRPPRRQPAADRLRRPRVRPDLHRHAVGLPGVHPAVREIVSGAVGRLRDRDRVDRACARARTAGRRDADAVLFAAARARPPSSAPGATASASCGRCCGSIAPSGRCRCSPRIGISLAIVAIGIAIPVFVTYLQEGVVPRLPTAVLSTGLMLLAFLSSPAA